MAYPALEKIGSRRRTASCNQASRLMVWGMAIKGKNGDGKDREDQIK
jgi:hypothetical protein